MVGLHGLEPWTYLVLYRVESGALISDIAGGVRGRKVVGLYGLRVWTYLVL
ncbi:hypothetical protein GCM10025791_44470 [Halioxenophilus aromaticivorans]|uniref:Uncharacterized protein n=1 Tax=Halioxenophilus aromaticivorans TaxID=1306992 RepID=A0AAV3U8I9_9ALTE